MDVDAELDALAADREHGASEITERALDLMRAIAAEAQAPLEALADAGARLVDAHPAMAPLVNLADTVLDRVEADGLSAFDAIEAEQERRRLALAQAGAALVDEAATVATYSRSGTVLAALRRAVDAGPRFSVLTSEARPGQEGLGVARELARAGVPATLATDVGLASLVRSADVLLVGADALCQAGLVNKIGTGAIAREAARAGVPTYVIAGTDKLYPPSLRKRPPLTARASMGHRLPDGVHEAMPVFECEPLDVVDAVVTEDGRLSPSEVHERLEARTLHPLLAERLRPRFQP